MLVKAPDTKLPIRSPWLAIVNRQTEVSRELAGARTLASLEPLPQWVGWCYETRKGQSKRTKVPYRPSGMRARANDPATWRTRKEVQNYAGQPVYFDGAGLMLGKLRDSSRLCAYGIDLDTCRDPKTGEIAGWAAEELARFPSYAEVSPSGTGVKLFGLYRMADLPALLDALGQTYGKQRYGFKHCLDGGEHGPGIEFYAAVRFFTVTGRRLPDAPAELHLTDVGPLVHLIREHGGSSGGGHGPHRAGTRAAGTECDNSRSAAAMRLGKKLVAMGASYEVMRDALLGDPGEVGEWAHEKGLANGERELWRI
jgi:putative DNA primase/helicase